MESRWIINVARAADGAWRHFFWVEVRGDYTGVECRSILAELRDRFFAVDEKTGKAAFEITVTRWEASGVAREP